jgi:hypothetical protein
MFYLSRKDYLENRIYDANEWVEELKLLRIGQPVSKECPKCRYPITICSRHKEFDKTCDICMSPYQPVSKVRELSEPIQCPKCKLTIYGTAEDGK